MTASPSRVGILTRRGLLREEQRAAADWLAARDGIAIERVAFDDLAAPISDASSESSTEVSAESSHPSPDESYPGLGVGDRRSRTDPLRRFDALWWHRAAPIAESDPRRRGRRDRSIPRCRRWSPPDAPRDGVGRPPLRRVGPARPGRRGLARGADRRAVAVAVRRPPGDGVAGGTPTPRPGARHGPTVRYERVLPERGEPLASTLRGDTAIPDEVTAVSWRVGEGDERGGPGCSRRTRRARLVRRSAGYRRSRPRSGVHDPDAPGLAGTRDCLVAGCLRSLAVDDGTPARPTDADDMRRLRDRIDDAGEDGPRRPSQVPPHATR